MTEDEIAGKLAYIARASAGELTGWVSARKIDKREPFDGEQAAILARAKQLNITVEGISEWLGR